MNRASIPHLIGISFCFLFVIIILAITYSNLFPRAVLAAPAQQGGQPTLSFNGSNFSVTEGNSITIIVQLNPASDQTVTVNYFTQGATATPGTNGDYIEVSGVLTFTPGVTSQSFVIATNNDTVDEPNELVRINLVNPVNAVLSGGGVNLTENLTIQDDDASPTSTPTRTPTGNQPVFTDQYEPNNNFGDAAEIAAGQRFCSVTLWPVGDEDYFTFYAIRGFKYQIFTDDLEAGLDTVLTVYNPQGESIGTNDNFQGERRSQVEIEASRDGFYFARIINQDPSDPADRTFCFEVRELPGPTSTPTGTAIPPLAGGDSCEWNSTIEFACLIGVGETKSLNFVPTLGSPQDTDMFRLWVKIGVQYTCETLNLSPYTDTNIILLNQNGQPFSPWIGNDDREDATGDVPDFSSKVTYLANYTGWLYIEVGPVNVPDYEDAALQTYDLRCSSTIATATPTVTATFVPVPPSTGGTFPTSTPLVTATSFVFPTFPPTPTPFVLPSSTPTPTPPIVQFQPLPTSTPAGGGGQDLSINVTLYYDVNNSFTPELTEGIANVSVFLFDSATGDLLSFGTTNETGVIRFSPVQALGPVRVVVPFLNYNQIVVGGSADLLLRIAPQPLPIGIP